MKNYKIFYKEAKGNLPHIYCDMDGVLCDFIVQAKKATGVIFTQDKSDEHWEVIKKYRNFWSNMPWMPGGKQLWNYINKYKPHILSAYVEESFDPNCIPGKSHWARTKLGIAPGRINLVKRVQKQNYAKVAGQPAILIDDYRKNTDQFTQKGGIGILHTSTPNTIKQLKKLGF